MTDNADEESLESNGMSSLEQSPSIEHGSDSAIGSLLTSLPCSAPSAPSSSEVDDSERSRRRSSISIIQSIRSTSHLLTTIDARRR